MERHKDVSGQAGAIGGEKRLAGIQVALRQKVSNALHRPYRFVPIEPQGSLDQLSGRVIVTGGELKNGLYIRKQLKDQSFIPKLLPDQLLIPIREYRSDPSRYLLKPTQRQPQQAALG